MTQRNSDKKEGSPTIDDQTESDLRHWLKEVPDDPTEAACSAKTLVGSSRMQLDKAKLYAAVVGYRAALQLVASDKLWRAFVEHPSWAEFVGHKPRLDNKKEQLRWMMVFIFEAKDERGKDRANIYRGALQAKFDAGARPESILAFVREAGGIDAAYRQAPKAQKADSRSSVTDKSATSDDSDQRDGCDDDRESVNSDGSGDASESDRCDPSGSSRTEIEKVAKAPTEAVLHAKEKRLVQARFSAKVTAVEKNGLVPWVVSMSPHDVGRRIQRYVNDGKVTLDCTLTSDSDGWIKAVCTDIRRSGSKV